MNFGQSIAEVLDFAKNKVYSYEYNLTWYNMKKVLALGILYGFFCGSTDALADDLRNITHYGKWAEEADGADTSVVDGAQEPAVPANSNTSETATTSDDSMKDKAPMANGANVLDDAPMQDGYVPIAGPMGRATTELEDRPSAGAKTASTVNDKDWWKHPQLEFGILAGGSGSYIPVDEK